MKARMQILRALRAAATSVALMGLMLAAAEPSQAQNPFPSSPAEAVVAMKNSGLPVAQIATALQGTFRQSAAQVAALLKTANFTAGEIANALKGTFNSGADAVAAALRAAGFTAEQVAAALASTFNLGAAQAAAVLRAAGFASGEVLKAVRTEFQVAVEAAKEIGETVCNLSGAALEQALIYAGYAASTVQTLLQEGHEAAIRVVNESAGAGTTLASRSARASALGLYDGYFRLVAAGASMRPLHTRYRNALQAAGIDASTVRVGHSSYLDRAPGEVAMTDCNNIYFPSGSIVADLTRGEAITRSELAWLLHELGHTAQCRSAGREGFANRWFGELPPVVLDAVAAGKADPETIHDAMPLERDADAYSSRNQRAVEAALGPAAR
jgi:hypothetical protein